MPSCPRTASAPTRGDKAVFPENTVPAFKSAAEKRDAMVEMDVQRCATGELVIMHDPTVDRTTSGTGETAELTFEQIRVLDAGAKKTPRFAGTKVPTFDEAIDCLPKTSLSATFKKSFGGNEDAVACGAGRNVGG